MFGTISRVQLKEGVTVEQVTALFDAEDRPASLSTITG